MHLCRRLVSVAGVLLALSATAPLRAQVADLQVSPENVTLKVGERKPLYASAFDRSGNIITTARFRYTSASNAVATVDAEGILMGRGPGVTLVTVATGSRSVRVTVTVVNGPQAAAPSAPTSAPAGATRIIIDPATVYLLPSESQRLVARAIGGDGTVLGNVNALWRSLTAGAISISDSLNGVVVGIGAGAGTIEARLSNGLVATAPVQVSAVPFEIEAPSVALSPDQLDTLHVVVPAQSGRRLEAGLTFTSTNPAVVAIGPTGIMQAKGPGQCEIVVSGYFQERRVTATVHRPIAYFALQPAPAEGPVSVPIQGWRVVTGRAEAADSTAIPEAPLRWEVADTTVAVYDTASHRLTGRKQGTTTLVLSVRGYEPKVWTVNVVPALVALTTRRAGLRVGDSLAVAAHLKDEAGTDYGEAPELAWTSDRPEVARVTAGNVAALAPGHALVVAAAPWGRSDTLDAIVTGDLLLTSDRRLRGTPALYQLALRRPDSILPLLTDTRRLYAPALSPDRRRVVYSATADGRNYDLWIADADGRNARVLTADSIPETAPAWTPDGQKVVYTITTRRQGDQLMVINADGTGRRGLTTPPGTAEAPAVSPDGQWVAFVGGRDRDKPDAFVMPIGGGAPRAITTGKDKERQVRWMANGDLVILVEADDRDDGFQIVRIAQGTNTRTTLAVTPYPITGFAVSRDGKTLAYVTTEPLENVRNQRTKSVLYLQAIAAGSTPTAVRTPVTETLGFPAF